MLIDSAWLISLLQLLQWTACPGDTCRLSHSCTCCSQHNSSTHADSHYWGEVLSCGEFFSPRLAVKHLPAKAVGLHGPPQIYGSTRFSFSSGQIQSLLQSSHIGNDAVLNISAHVTDSSTGETIYMYWKHKSSGFAVTHLPVATFQGGKWRKQLRSTWRGTHSSCPSATFLPHWSLRCSSPQ